MARFALLGLVLIVSASAVFANSGEEYREEYGRSASYEQAPRSYVVRYEEPRRYYSTPAVQTVRYTKPSVVRYAKEYSEESYEAPAVRYYRPAPKVRYVKPARKVVKYVEPEPVRYVQEYQPAPVVKAVRYRKPEPVRYEKSSEEYKSPAVTYYNSKPRQQVTYYKPKPEVRYQKSSESVEYSRPAPVQYYAKDYSNNYEPVNYNFAYQVRSEGKAYGSHEGSSAEFGHAEQRNGDRTDGKYYVELPDGRLQTVEYYVEGNSGYVAKVTYTGGNSGSSEQYKSSDAGETQESS